MTSREVRTAGRRIWLALVVASLAAATMTVGAVADDRAALTVGLVAFGVALSYAGWLADHVAMQMTRWAWGLDDKERG